MRTTGSRARSALLALAAAGALSVAAVPSMAFGAISDNGGAVRDPEDSTAAVAEEIVGGPAKNVILIIGDGMGASEITVARNYAEGAAGTLAGIDTLPLTGQYTTYDLTPEGDPHYVPDSASTASAWATGTKTYTGALSVDVDDEEQATLLEIAKANGMKTGDVSTSEIQDATPAALFSHVNARGCYGPVDTSVDCPTFAVENGGLGSITEQLLGARPDLTLGGGSATMAETAVAGPWAGLTLEQQAADRGFTYLTDSADLAGVEAADQTAPVLGLFTEGNFPVRYTGPAATEGGGDLPAVACTPNPAWDPATSLATMTDTAIGLLDTDEDGFFLQVESASIDKRDHAADACGQIGETLELDEAVQTALEFARADGDTMVVVTADHAHTSQIVGSTPPGLSTNLLTTEGQEMIVAYGTSPEGGSQQHTGAMVPIAAYGPGAANVVGLTDNTDLFFTAVDTLGLERDTAALSADATIALQPNEVAPGGASVATVSGLDGDRQATATLAGEPVGQVDVIDGTAVFPLTAADATGEYPVVVTGAQSGTVLEATLVVTETPDPAPAPAPGEDDGTPAGAGASATGGSGPLATTDGAAAPIALLALLMMAAGTAWVVRRRRATAH